MDENSEKQGLSRGDFLKNMGIGVGAAALGGMLSVPSVSAEETKKKRCIVAITNGGNNPNRAILGLLVAISALDDFAGVHVWMTLEGAEIAHKKKSERIDSPIFKKFGTAAELVKKLKDKGATFGVCPPCAEYMGSEGGDKYDFVEKQGANWLTKNMQESVVAWM